MGVLGKRFLYEINRWESWECGRRRKSEIGDRRLVSECFFQLVEGNGEITRIGGLERDREIRFRVGQRQRPGVECQAGDQFGGDARAVKWVGQNGVAKMIEVCPDLMRAACFRTGFDQGLIFEALQHSELSEGRLAALWIYGCAFAASDVGAKLGSHRFLIPGRVPLDDGVIDFGNLVMGELVIEISVCIRVTCQHHHPAGVFIEAVNDP